MVQIAAPLRLYSQAPAEIRLAALTVRAALGSLRDDHPRLYRSVCDETGAVRRHVNLFVNGRHVRDREGVDTPLSSGDALMIMPAVSGG